MPAVRDRRSGANVLCGDVCQAPMISFLSMVAAGAGPLKREGPRKAASCARVKWWILVPAKRVPATSSIRAGCHVPDTTSIVRRQSASGKPWWRTTHVGIGPVSDPGLLR